MPCLITALTRSTIEKTTRKNSKQQNKQNKNFTAETRYLKLKAASNNVKIQSDKTLTSQIYFFLTIQQMNVFLNETS